jgi:hypothetical protein
MATPQTYPKLRILGCSVAYLRQAPRDAAAAGKLGPRAKRGRLIGYGLSGIYEHGQLRRALGYVIAGADNSITVTRHVLFNEDALFDPINSGELEPHVYSDPTGPERGLPYGWPAGRQTPTSPAWGC